MLLVFRCFTNKIAISVSFFCSLKTKQLTEISKIFSTDPYVTSRDLQVRKTILARSSSEFNSSLQHGTSIQEIAAIKRTSLISEV